MHIEELAGRVEYVSAGYADQFGIDRTDDWILLKLTEEVGELAQAHLTAAGQSRDRGLTAVEQDAQVEQELVDVLAMCLVYARRRGIDLPGAFERKWFRYEEHHRERGFTAEG